MTNFAELKATHCNICGKKLTDPQSLQRGAGPVCYGKTHGPGIPFSNTLTSVATSIDYDIELVRDKWGSEITNVPWTVVLHSPDGFSWGPVSAASCDLALNILNAVVPPGSDGRKPEKCYHGYASQTAFSLHRLFAEEMLTMIGISGGVTLATIWDWLSAHPMEDEAKQEDLFGSEGGWVVPTEQVEQWSKNHKSILRSDGDD